MICDIVEGKYGGYQVKYRKRIIGFWSYIKNCDGNRAIYPTMTEALKAIRKLHGEN